MIINMIMMMMNTINTVTIYAHGSGPVLSLIVIKLIITTLMTVMITMIIL